MSSKQPISKHRTGGPHSGQSQSNQRQSDYSRSNADRFQSHNMRQNNAGVPTHLSTMQVNMPSQPNANPLQPNSQAMTNPQMIMNNRYQNSNSPLIQSQGIPLGHANNLSPQTSGHCINQQRFGHFMPQNSNRIPNQNRQPLNYMRHSNIGNPSGISNFPALNQGYSSIQTNIYNYPGNHWSPQPNIPYYPLLFFSDPTVNMNQFSRNYPFTPQQMNIVNINNTDMNNSQVYKSNEVQQQQPFKKGRPKNPAEIFDTNGTKFDLEVLASENKPALTNTPDKTNEITTASINDSENINNQQPINGANKVEIDCVIVKSMEDVNVIHENERESNNEIEEHDSVQSKQVIDVELKQSDENSSLCDINEVDSSQTNTVQISSGSTSINIDETEKENSEVEDITEKINDVLITSQVSDDEVTEINNNTKIIVDDNEIEINEDATVPSRDENHNTNVSAGDIDIEDDPILNHTETPTIDENQNDLNIPMAKENKELENINQINDNNNNTNITPTNTSSTATTNINNTTNLQYGRELLLELRKNPSKDALEHSNQENLKDIIRKDIQNSFDSLLPFFYKNNRTPNDPQYRNKSHEHKVQTYRRPSQPSRNYPDPKSRKITSTSLHSDYPHSEDGWRPGRITATDPEEIETESLLKNVRAILNKLTPQNYQTLLDQFKNLKIDSRDRLIKVIDLIFDKAVREPAFVVQYAGFCSELIHIKVSEENDKKLKFKSLLIEKCQHTFYKKIYKDVDEEILKKLEETDDPAKRKILEEQLDDEKRLSRKRSVGNIKLIAELYKLNMLNANIMFTCFDYLIKNQHEDYIECLCALITNIGKNLTDAIKNKFPGMMPTFDSVFDNLTKIYNQQADLKVSSRIRFMILDLLDLRKNNWVPRRKVEGPKLIAQIHEDMEIQQRLKHDSLNEIKKKKITVQQSDESWYHVDRQKRKTHSGVTTKMNLNLSVLKDFSENNNRSSTGNSLATFSIFKTGSHGGSTPSSQSRSSSSNYESKNQILSNDKNQRVFHDSLNAKNQHGRRDERKISDVTNYQMEKRSDNSQSQTKSDSLENLKMDPHLSQVKFIEQTNRVVDKYLGSGEFCDIINDINSFCSKSKYADFIAGSILSSIEKTSQLYNPREKWGEFLGNFFISYNCDIFESLKKVFAQYEEYKLDIPKFFEFIGEVLGYALLKVDEENFTGKKDILKNVVTSYNEISGSECILFREGFYSTIQTKNMDLMQEINPLFQTKEIKFPKLNDIINRYLKNLDLNELKIQIEENYPDKVSSEDFKSALYYKLVYNSINSKSGSHNVNNDLDKIKAVIEHFVRSEDDQVLFLLECADVWGSWNNPANLLMDIFTYLRQHKLVENDSFKIWSKDKRTKAISAAHVKRFLDGL